MTVYDCVWVGAHSGLQHPWDLFFSCADHLKDVSQNTVEICHLLGLEDKMGELASNLSYGDQKVLEIAMALSTQPSVLLFDEPTQGVSPKEADNIIQVIDKLSKTLTIVLIEHSIDMVLSLCNRITVLNYGEIIAEGSPGEISKNKEVQRIYLGEVT